MEYVLMFSPILSFSNKLVGGLTDVLSYWCSIDLYSVSEKISKMCVEKVFRF